MDVGQEAALINDDKERNKIGANTTTANQQGLDSKTKPKMGSKTTLTLAELLWWKYFNLVTQIKVHVISNTAS